MPLPRPAPRLSAARLAIRLSQDVAAAMAGEGESGRRGWSVSGGATANTATTTDNDADALPEQPKTAGGGGGGGWAVVKDNPW